MERQQQQGLMWPLHSSKKCPVRTEPLGIFCDYVAVYQLTPAQCYTWMAARTRGEHKGDCGSDLGNDTKHYLSNFVKHVISSFSWHLRGVTSTL